MGAWNRTQVCWKQQSLLTVEPCAFISTGIRATGNSAGLFVLCPGTRTDGLRIPNFRSSIRDVGKSQHTSSNVSLSCPANEDKQLNKTTWQVTRQVHSPYQDYVLDVCAEFLLPEDRCAGITGMFNYTSTGQDFAWLTITFQISQFLCYSAYK